MFVCQDSSSLWDDVACLFLLLVFCWLLQLMLFVFVCILVCSFVSCHDSLPLLLLYVSVLVLPVLLSSSLPQLFFLIFLRSSAGRRPAPAYGSGLGLGLGPGCDPHVCSDLARGLGPLPWLRPVFGLVPILVLAFLLLLGLALAMVLAIALLLVLYWCGLWSISWSLSLSSSRSWHCSCSCSWSCS